MTIEPVTIAALAALATLVLVSVLVPALVAAQVVRPSSGARRDRVGTGVYGTVAVAAIALLLAGLPVPFFLAAVVANIVLGRNEGAPFSRFPMFSRPAPVQWFIRLEDQDGDTLSGPASFGMPTSLIMKRFSTEVKQVAPGLSIRRAGHEARIAAAERVVDFLLVGLRRKPVAASRVTAVRLLYMEVAQGDDGLAVTSELLVERAP